MTSRQAWNGIFKFVIDLLLEMAAFILGMACIAITIIIGFFYCVLFVITGIVLLLGFSLPFNRLPGIFTQAMDFVWGWVD